MTRAALGLGLAALGRPGYMTVGHDRDLGPAKDPESMERHCHAMLDRAWELGIRHVDAARSYGRAEEFLARWLERRARTPADLIVSSKWGYTYTAGWRVDAEKHEVKDHTLPVFLRQLAETRALLGSHLDVYQIHSATLESGVLDDHAVLDALADLRDTGVALGLSVTGTGQAATLDRALGVARRGRSLFTWVQATWNLLERSAEPALARAHWAGRKVIVKEALANGRLSDPVQALAAALTRPWATTVLTGAATLSQLEQSAEALTSKFDESRLEVPAMDPQVYWSERSRLAWT